MLTSGSVTLSETHVYVSCFTRACAHKFFFSYIYVNINILYI